LYGYKIRRRERMKECLFLKKKREQGEKPYMLLFFKNVFQELLFSHFVETNC
jgi:hypothetical protein